MAYTGKDFKELPRPVILALETATLCGSVALVSQSQCLAEFSLQTGETHSRRLLAGIDWLLQETGIDWPAIDAVAVSLGPGSFTGLRIGLATAKGLALATSPAEIEHLPLMAARGRILAASAVAPAPPQRVS